MTEENLPFDIKSDFANKISVNYSYIQEPSETIRDSTYMYETCRQQELVTPLYLTTTKDNAPFFPKYKISPIKSPLRYPGGKSKALKYIVPNFPSLFKEYREPMIGGGSVFFEIRQKEPNLKFWINDINSDLYYFWKQCKEDISEIVEEICNVKRTYSSGRELFSTYSTKNENLNQLEKAVRYFVLNRITFSGAVDSAGYSNESFEKRFTDSSIERLKKSADLLKDVKITNYDYETLLTKPGEDVFIFLDPPYFSFTKSKLYGKRGNLHTEFDHKRFAKIVSECEHKWLITYDDSEEIRELFRDSANTNIYEWKLQYGMNSFSKDKASIGNELLISNYDICKDSQILSQYLKFTNEK
ncbi:DNA adenine methylase [Methanosarcina mazei]|uniref:DNA adenine methylase n=1 Tax=Methanosarcina mazei TaxID=2209 RepID=UPI00190FE82F|nr:DNA adenine methylase [Methanosarcina mazei]